MSRIGQHVAGAVLATAILGFTVFYAADRGYQRVDRLAQDATQAALAERDFEFLEALVAQWLVSLDLLYGHGGAYYWEGANQQAISTTDLIARLAEAQTITGEDAARVSELVSSADETSREYAFLSEPMLRERGEILRVRSDELTGDFVAWLESARENSSDRFENLTQRVVDQRRRSLHQAIASSLVYAAVLSGIWLWLSRRLVTPIERLTDAARRGEPPPPADDVRVSELRSLNETLASYVGQIRAESRAAREAEAIAKALSTELESILSTAPSSILTFDGDRRVATANRAAETDFRRSHDELIGAPVDTLLATIEGDDPLAEGSFEVQGLRGDGDSFPCLLAVSSTAGREAPQSFTVVARDISAQRNLEIELRQAQKLESVGQLAAGIAHEINTPVQFVSDSVTFLEEAFTDLVGVLNSYKDTVASQGLAAEATKSLVEVEEEADLEFVLSEGPEAIKRSLDGLSRVASIVRAMKDFAHPGSKEKVVSDLNHAIDTTLTVARGEYKYIAELELSLGEIPGVPCHLSDLNQVFLNLVVNAAHAIEVDRAGTGETGVIRVETRRRDGEVIVSVSDDGCGIPEDVRDRVFDPFFTTKTVGKGSGQGLAIAYNCVVEQHGGRLWFETDTGKGTTFYIALPLEDAP